MAAATKLDQTLSKLDEAISDFSEKFSQFQAKHPIYDIVANSQAMTREENVRTNLTFAFALNSLFYSTLRMTQTDMPAEVKTHPVHSQIKIVRDHYVKLDNVLKRKER